MNALDDFLLELNALPEPPSSRVAATKGRSRKPKAAIDSHSRFEDYAGSLAEEVIQLKAELAKCRDKAARLDQIRTLLREQEKSERSYKSLEDKIVALI